MSASDPTILFATQDFPPTEGGIARVYADLAAGFPPAKFIVSTTLPDGPAGSPPAGVTVVHEPFPMSRAHRFTSLLRWQRDLERLREYTKPDLLLCGNLRPLGPICRRVARKGNIPYYVFVHGNDLLAARRRWSGLRSVTWNRVFGDARRWIASSEAVRLIGIEELNLPAARSGVILPEVDTDAFHPVDHGEKLRLRREIGLKEDEAVVIFIGRLVTRKGLDRLMEVMARFGDARPWRLIVAGHGDPSPYQALAARLGISPGVIFRTAVPDSELRELLRTADLAVMPSRTIPERGDIEGFGVVFLEAAASGLPVVAGNSGGVVEAVEHGVTGLVVDGNDVDAIRLAIEELLNDPARRDNMGRAARARVVETFGPGSRAARLRRIIEADFTGAQ